MRILFLALSVPFPPTSGLRLRNWALLQALGRESHEVTLVSFAEPEELGRAHPELESVCGSVILVPLPSQAAVGMESYLNRLRALVSPLPYAAWRFRSLLLREAAERRLREDPVDLILCDEIYQVLNLPGLNGPPVLLNKCDAGSLILRRYLDQESNPLKRAYGFLEYWKVRRWEARCCAAVSGVWTCSSRDRAFLEDLAPSARFAVVPNAIDTTVYVPNGYDDGRTVLYVGGMDWFPNRDAVEFFAFRILPELRRLAPGARFRVAGQAPSPFRRRFRGVRQIEFSGNVPDMREEVTRAAVCVVPLRIGSGTRLKILEAAAMGKAIVSTWLGAEGLGFVPDEEIVLADYPKEFARGVAELLSDERRRRELGFAARRRVESDYSLPVLQSAIREALAGATRWSSS